MGEKNSEERRDEAELDTLRDRVSQLEAENAQHRETEAALRETVEHLEVLFEQAPDGYYINDLKGNFYDGNKAAEEIVGYERAELIGKSFLKAGILPPEQIPRAAKLLALNALGKSTGPDVFTLIRKDGKQVVVEVRTHPVSFGGKTLVLGMARDITDHKRVEAALKEARERYTMAVEAGCVGVWDWDLKTNEIYLDPILKAMLGYEDHEISNQLDDWGQYVHPDDVDLVMRRANDHLDGKTREYEVEHRMLHKDGGIRWFLARGTVFHDERGKPVRMLGTDTDITPQKLLQEELREAQVSLESRVRERTAELDAAVQDLRQQIQERKRAEETLRESEAKFRSLVEACFDGVLIHRENRILECNAAFADMLGYCVEELMGLKTKMLIEKESRDSAEMHAQDGHGRIYEVTGVRKDKSRLPVEVITNECTHDGEAALLTAVRDISDRKRSEQELVSLERLRAIADMSGGVSHNLNNLLTAVLGPAQLIDRMTNDPGIKAYCDAIVSSALRAADLVDRLHLSVRGAREKIQAVSVSEIAQKAVDATLPVWKDEAESRGVDIEVTCELRTEARARGAAGGLQDVVVNMILNAVDALPHGGSIMIESWLSGDEVVLSVTDTGIGMETGTARRVFEPFFTTKHDVGSGLGLSTAHTMVKGWGGDIEVESDPGQGTRFRIRLLAWPEDRVVQKQEEFAGGSVSGPGMMVVDDEPSVCSFVTGYLARTYDVVSALSGAEALRRFEPGRFAVAFIDLGMKGMAGNELATELKRMEPGLITVLVTGWRLEETDPRLKPFDLQIQKPIRSLQILGSVAARAVELHENRRRDRI